MRFLAQRVPDLVGIQSLALQARQIGVVDGKIFHQQGLKCSAFVWSGRVGVVTVGLYSDKPSGGKPRNPVQTPSTQGFSHLASKSGWWGLARLNRRHHKRLQVMDCHG